MYVMEAKLVDNLINSHKIPFNRSLIDKRSLISRYYVCLKKAVRNTCIFVRRRLLSLQSLQPSQVENGA